LAEGSVEAVEKALLPSKNVRLLSKSTFLKDKGLVMIIDRLPRFVNSFFRPMQLQLSKPQFAHLWALVLGILINLRTNKLIHLAACMVSGCHRTALGIFLAHSHWDAATLLHQAVWRLLRDMRPQPGEVIYLLLDEMRNGKRGRQMALLSKMYDHKNRCFVRGHMIITAAIAFRGLILPWKVVLWKPKKGAGRSHRKSTQIAADLIETFAPPAGLKVRVLFDAFYLCPAVTKACEHKGFKYFSVASKNRSFRPASGHRAKKQIRQIGPGLLKHAGHFVWMRRARGRAKMRIAAIDGRLARIGPVRMVLSKRPRNPWKKMVAIVTNETNLTDRQIVAIYERRWAIEVLFKELRQDLGLGVYQVQHEEAILNHLHLCCLAHLLLTHRSLLALGAQAKKPNKDLALPSMKQRLQDLREAVRHDQIRPVLRKIRNVKLKQELQTTLLAA
jgi:SRSO17 transposase